MDILKTKYRRTCLLLTLLFTLGVANAQMPAVPSVQKIYDRELKVKFSDDGKLFFKGTFLNQAWVRYTENNPGSTLNGHNQDGIFDIGLRRTRIQLFGQVHDKVFIYTQVGQNNLAFNSARKQGIFFLDALGELKLAGEHLSMGAGLTGWGGVSRYASPSVGTILSMDAPLYLQATNDATDQFLRKFSVYAKGKLGKLDYRVALSKPMTIQNSSVQTGAISEHAQFAGTPPQPQVHGYLMYQFWDQESNLTPYTVGSYLGKKRVMNIGAGFLNQSDAMWRTVNAGADTVASALRMFSADFFLDKPLQAESQNAITAYVAYTWSDFGKGYLRNLAVMNPMSSAASTQTLNGSGNGYPAIGTGSTVYLQAGYLMKHDLLGKWGTLQPYVAAQASKFDRLADPMVVGEVGFNWLIDGHRAKLSLNYQNRPVFDLGATGPAQQTGRRGSYVLQLQTSI